MIFEIKKYPEKILLKPTKKVANINADTKKIIHNMFEIMYKNNGIGLSANQIGINQQIAVISCKIEDKDVRIVLINPKIIKKRGKQFSDEGCLSIPGFYFKIKRANYIKVNAINENGIPIVVEGEGLLARVLQHEIDHLNGKLIIHRLPLLKKIKTKKKLKKLIQTQ